MNTSDSILVITLIFIAWQAFETRRSVNLSITKEQPLLEIEFKNNGAEIELRNIGNSPAYSPSIESLKITGGESFDFDPLHDSLAPILQGESRKVWMHHTKKNEGSIHSFTESIPVLKSAIINSTSNIPTQLNLEYFDKNGIKLIRNLYIKISGSNLAGDQKIYTTTSSE